MSDSEISEEVKAIQDEQVADYKAILQTSRQVKHLLSIRYRCWEMGACQAAASSKTSLLAGTFQTRLDDKYLRRRLRSCQLRRRDISLNTITVTTYDRMTDRFNLECQIIYTSLSTISTISRFRS